jgi:hypothetical protein
MRPSAALIFIVSLALFGCSAVQPIPDSRTPGYLHLELDPRDTEVFIDDDFKGRADGWRAQTIPVTPGARRVELRADGYMTQRFDIEIGEGEQVTLRLRLEPTFDELDLEREQDQ